MNNTSQEEPCAIWRHGMAEIEPGLRLHYVSAGDGQRTILLLHGFLQTWWEWRLLIPLLVKAGFRVVAPDYVVPDNHRDRWLAMTSKPWRRTYIGYCTNIFSPLADWTSWGTTLD